jgi:RNA polymerase sigma factor (sigma-70 family)
MQAPSTHISLLKALNAGEVTAWSEFHTRYCSVIEKWCFARLKNHNAADARSLAEEVASNIVVEIRGKLPSYLDKLPSDEERRPSFGRWLRTVTNNAAVDAVRKRKLRHGSADSDVYDILQQIPDDSDSVGAAVQTEYMRDLFERDVLPDVLAELNENQRLIIQLLGLFDGRTRQGSQKTGPSTAEVAKQVGMSVGAVFQVRSRVRERLKEVVREKALDEELESLLENHNDEQE